MKNLEIRIISGEVYVPLYAVVELLKQANPLMTAAQAQQAAIKQQAGAIQQGVGLGQVVGGVLHPACGDNRQLPAFDNGNLGRGPSIEYGDTQFIPHEQDYRGLSR